MNSNSKATGIYNILVTLGCLSVMYAVYKKQLDEYFIVLPALIIVFQLIQVNSIEHFNGQSATPLNIVQKTLSQPTIETSQPTKPVQSTQPVQQTQPVQATQSTQSSRSSLDNHFSQGTAIVNNNEAIQTLVESLKQAEIVNGSMSRYLSFESIQPLSTIQDGPIASYFSNIIKPHNINIKYHIDMYLTFIAMYGGLWYKLDLSNNTGRYVTISVKNDSIDNNSNNALRLFKSMSLYRLNPYTWNSVMDHPKNHVLTQYKNILDAEDSSVLTNAFICDAEIVYLHLTIDDALSLNPTLFDTFFTIQTTIRQTPNLPVTLEVPQNMAQQNWLTSYLLAAPTPFIESLRSSLNQINNKYTANIDSLTTTQSTIRSIPMTTVNTQTVQAMPQCHKVDKTWVGLDDKINVDACVHKVPSCTTELLNHHCTDCNSLPLATHTDLGTFTKELDIGTTNNKFIQHALDNFEQYYVS